MDPAGLLRDQSLAMAMETHSPIISVFCFLPSLLPPDRVGDVLPVGGPKGVEDFP
jgi:hypothetical protein